MKKYTFFAVNISLIVLTLSVCAGNPLREGWLDENTYRIIGTGYAKRHATSKAQRIDTAYKAALLDAQMRALEIFSDLNVAAIKGESKNYIKRDKKNNIEFITQVRGFSKRGAVQGIIFYPKHNAVKLIYLIRQNNLKNFIENRIIINQ